MIASGAPLESQPARTRDHIRPWEQRKINGTETRGHQEDETRKAKRAEAPGRPGYCYPLKAPGLGYLVCHFEAGSKLVKILGPRLGAFRVVHRSSAVLYIASKFQGQLDVAHFVFGPSWDRFWSTSGVT